MNKISVKIIVFAILCISLYSYGFCDEIAPPYGLAGKEPFLADQPMSVNVRNIIDQSPIPEKCLGWLPQITGRIYGPVKDGDGVKIEVVKDGKTIRSYRVALNVLVPLDYEYFQDFSLLNTEDKDPINSQGEFKLIFKYTDFATEKEKLLGEKKISIIKIAKADPSAGKHIWKYGLSTENLPAMSYAFLKAGSYNSSGSVYFYTWINKDNDFIEDIKFKITVNGTAIQLPSDFLLGCNRKLAIEQVEDMYDFKKGNVINNRDYNYLIELSPKIYWGEKMENNNKEWLCAIDYPGNWSVKVYSKGKMFRDFRFKVNEEGLIVLHEEQNSSKKGALNLGPMRFFIETYYPNPDDFDERFNPEAIKKGSFFGHTWISQEIKGMLNSLPPKKSGKMPFPSPKLPPDKK